MSGEGTLAGPESGLYGPAMAEPFSLQVVFDATSPHVLADWWAEALGWQVEPQDESFINKMIDEGFATEADTVIHNGTKRWATGCAVIAEPGPGRPRLLFQQVPEPKSVKNRIHLDLRPGTQDPDELDAIRSQLFDMGATQVGRGQQGNHQWIIFADPEGNEFCL